jgi:hypothetical protein
MLRFESGLKRENRNLRQRSRRRCGIGAVVRKVVLRELSRRLLLLKCRRRRVWVGGSVSRLEDVRLR